MLSEQKGSDTLYTPLGTRPRRIVSLYLVEAMDVAVVVALWVCGTEFAMGHETNAGHIITNTRLHQQASGMWGRRRHHGCQKERVPEPRLEAKRGVLRTFYNVPTRKPSKNPHLYTFCISS